jgi:hypothetical protein
MTADLLIAVGVIAEVAGGNGSCAVIVNPQILPPDDQAGGDRGGGSRGRRLSDGSDVAPPAENDNAGSSAACLTLRGSCRIVHAADDRDTAALRDRFRLGRDTGKVDTVIDELEDYMVNAKLHNRSTS